MWTIMQVNVFYFVLRCTQTWVLPSLRNLTDLHFAQENFVMYHRLGDIWLDESYTYHMYFVIIEQYWKQEWNTNVKSICCCSFVSCKRQPRLFSLLMSFWFVIVICCRLGPCIYYVRVFSRFLSNSACILTLRVRGVTKMCVSFPSGTHLRDQKRVRHV